MFKKLWAIQEVKLMGSGGVTVYVSCDTDDATIDEGIEAYRVVWDLPPGKSYRANIIRLTSGQVWRTALLSGQGEWADTAPFGPVKKKDDLRFELVGVS